jgi:hypothetical protein
MSVPCKFDRSLLSHDEYMMVRLTHHPAIYEFDPAELQSVLIRLRQMRDKERTLARQKQREMRGKDAPRGGSFPGTAEQPLRRKQVFASAKKRVKKELNHLRKLEARTTHVEAARRALALRRAANFQPVPPTYPASNDGMRPMQSRRRRTRVPPNRIGSVSQATKVAQAVRDSRS